MALANYSELADMVARGLDRTDRTAEIQEWVRLVELEVERKLELRAQQMSTTGTLTSGSTIVETPAGILTPDRLIFSGSPPVSLDVVSFDTGTAFEFANAGSARPSQATVWGITSDYKTQIRVWPAPSGDAPWTLYYTTEVTPLTAAAPTNYLLRIAPDIYYFGAMYHGSLFDQDDLGAARWQGPYLEQMRSLKRVEKLARIKVGRFRMRTPAQYLTE